MAEFCIKIAGYVAAVTSIFDSTKDYCAQYLTEEPPEFSVVVTREDMELEQRLAYEEALEEGFKPRIFTDPFLDRAVIQRKIAEQLLEREVLLVHGSAVAVDGEGYLFTAKSGTGKSTHTRYWMQTFGDRAVMVNDDKPFVRFEGDTLWLCGAPWSGKHGLHTNVTVPLKGICLMERGTEIQIFPTSAEELLPRLLHESCAPLDEGKYPVFEQLVKRLSKAVPLWKLHIMKNSVAAEIAYEAMKNP